MAENERNLDKYKFFKSTSKDNAEIVSQALQIAEAAARLKKIEHLFFNRLEEDKETEEELGVLIDEQLKWVQARVGLNVDSRKIKTGSIIIYDEENFRSNRLSSSNVSEETFGLFKMLTKEIAIRNREQRAQMFSAISHELIHAIANLTIRVESDGDYTDGKVEDYSVNATGYCNTNGTFLVFNEVVTELMNIEFLQTLRSSGGHDYLSDSRIGHAIHVIVFEAIFKKVATLAGITTEQLMTEIYEGYLTGDFSKLRIIESTLGKGALKKISSLTKKDSSPSGKLRELMDDFGIDMQEIKNKLKAYSERREFTILDKVVINKDKK